MENYDFYIKTLTLIHKCGVYWYYPVCARLFWLSCAFVCDHRKRRAASPGLWGQRTPRGKGKGQGYGHYNLWANAALLGRDLLGKSTLFFPKKLTFLFRPRDPSKKLWQVLGINFLQFLALESCSKGEL